MPDIKALYTDRDIIIVEKQPGMSSEIDDSETDAPTAAGKLCGCTCYPVHRLDKGTGGVLVLAKNERAAAMLSAVFSQHKAEKHYLAVVSGTPDPTKGEMRDLLFHDRRCNKSFIVRRARRGAKEALLEYSLQSTATSRSGAPISLVSVRLHTGRTHQIRVQFASRKLPLLGDRKYGSRENDCKTALWCNDISFIHPLNGNRIEVHSSPPQTYPWSCFDGTASYPDSEFIY